MKIETLKSWLPLLGLALLFGAVNLGMYIFVPYEFTMRYCAFEAELSLLTMIVVIVSFGLIPAVGFSLVFRLYGWKGTDSPPKLRSFSGGLLPGFSASILLVSSV